MDTTKAAFAAIGTKAQGLRSRLDAVNHGLDMEARRFLLGPGLNLVLKGIEIVEATASFGEEFLAVVKRMNDLAGAPKAEDTEPPTEGVVQGKIDMGTVDLGTAKVSAACDAEGHIASYTITF